MCGVALGNLKAQRPQSPTQPDTVLSEALPQFRLRHDNFQCLSAARGDCRGRRAGTIEIMRGSLQTIHEIPRTGNNPAASTEGFAQRATDIEAYLLVGDPRVNSLPNGCGLECPSAALPQDSESVCIIEQQRCRRRGLEDC